LILTSTFVSFSHGSNDGQKGVGLLMIIFIAIVPAKFAMDHSRKPASLKKETSEIQHMLLQVDLSTLKPADAAYYVEISDRIDSIDNRLTGVASFSSLSNTASVNIRKDILNISKKSTMLLNHLLTYPVISITPAWKKSYVRHVDAIKTYTEYSPWWVIFMISVSLGLGTMIGWKRIVVTLGEKIGKSRLTYAQGVAANLVAASTISGSSLLGLPVSTTHVLSSGIAGTMVSGNGMKNLQGKTLASIGIAWLITIPVTMLFSGMLFLLFRLILS
jgi:PiT family inorganic phosphate transporter